MPLQLERLIYTSRAVGQGDSLLGVSEIVGQAQSNNDGRDITGALAVHGGCFLQVLEGSRHALTTLLERLEVDSRHNDLQIVSWKTIAAREFVGWAMAGPLSGDAFATVVHAAVDRTSNDAEIVDFLVERLRPVRIAAEQRDKIASEDASGTTLGEWRPG